MGASDYDEMHRMENEIQRLKSAIELQERILEATRERITDMEAERFVDRIELETDLQRWSDGIAAHVGRDLEEIADKLLAAIEADRRGEDVRSALYEIHGDVVNVISDMMAGTLNEAEAILEAGLNEADSD